MTEPVSLSTVLEKGPYLIRPIQAKDSAAICAVIKDVLEKELGCDGDGYASKDKEMEDLYTYYQASDMMRYWVVEDTRTGMVVGGGGYERLKGTTEAEGVCEFQKFYLYPHTRGLGIGKAITQLAIDWARQDGYRTIYLESVKHMLQAHALYEHMGFERIDHHLGATGHHNRCEVRMVLHLTHA